MGSRHLSMTVHSIEIGQTPGGGVTIDLFTSIAFTVVASRRQSHRTSPLAPDRGTRAKSSQAPGGSHIGRSFTIIGIMDIMEIIEMIWTIDNGGYARYDSD